MDIMFWIWLGVIILTAILEIITTDVISIWFTFGAIIPLILSITTDMSIAWQVVIFLGLSAILIASLRKITMKLLFKNSNAKTNTDALIGQKLRLLETADFDTLGKVKIKDVVWNVVGESQETIEKGSTVEVLRISGNKLVVKACEEKVKESEKTKKETK